MLSININTFIHTPAAVCDLQGICWSYERASGVPCRIKVGPRRWLERRVIPEELCVTLWQEKEGRTTYLQREPVQTSTAPDGTLTVDLVAFVREYFGKERLSYCSSDIWKWEKNRGYSNVFHTTDFGMASDRSAWLDMTLCHSDLYLMPGTLNLCGHDVRHIDWKVFCHELSSAGEDMRPLTEALLSGPHTLGAKEAIRALRAVKSLNREGFGRVHIRTDRGDFQINRSLMEDSFLVSLPGVEALGTDYFPAPETSALEILRILLQLMEAPSEEAIRAVLETNRERGLLRKQG